MENTPAARAFTGLAWLFLGVPTNEELLYASDWQAIRKSHPERFRLDCALSREQTNAAGGRMYVQNRAEEHAEEIFTRMSVGAHLYCCGLKEMMPGVVTVMERVCGRKGLVWAELLKSWKERGQWHVEVY